MADGTTRWDLRIARARHLADRYPAAAGILTFYAALAAYQGLLGASDDPPRDTGRDTGLPGNRLTDLIDRERALAAIPGFLDWLARTAPAPLAGTAVGGLCRLGAAEWRRLLELSLARPPADTDPGQEPAMFVVEAVLQPFAEHAATLLPEPVHANAGGTPDRRISGRAPRAAGEQCPVCGDLPVAGILREEGQGARRSLLCARCLTEWPSRRVLCAGCGEDRFDALPVYAAEQFAHVRVDACNSCRRYLKTIDASRDGLAVPLVDDLASVTLDLWAREQGYTRLRANLLRT